MRSHTQHPVRTKKPNSQQKLWLDESFQRFREITLHAQEKAFNHGIMSQFLRIKESLQVREEVGCSPTLFMSGSCSALGTCRRLRRFLRGHLNSRTKTSSSTRHQKCRNSDFSLRGLAFLWKPVTAALTYLGRKNPLKLSTKGHINQSKQKWCSPLVFSQSHVSKRHAATTANRILSITFLTQQSSQCLR